MITLIYLLRVKIFTWTWVQVYLTTQMAWYDSVSVADVNNSICKVFAISYGTQYTQFFHNLWAWALIIFPCYITFLSNTHILQFCSSAQSEQTYQMLLGIVCDL